ncbi:MAG: HAMP domain-containing histidine kinase [Propionibacterium sp.]|nr:HAMP domain-containing histidine kinase [Propionibacterium sp.]
MWVLAGVLLSALVVALCALAVTWRDLCRSRDALSHLRAYHEERMARPNVLSHELRTPLTVVQGSAELLLEESPGPLNDVQRGFVATIAENSHQVIEMANDLLEEARIESELFNMHPERVEVRQLVRECVRNLRRVHAAPIRLDSRGAPLHLALDPVLMRQAITNLINNAARHAGEGVTITVSVLDSEETVTVAVSDDGEGMTPQEREALFVPFATGGSRRPGTGLGMMITQRIVELHGGRVLVDTIARRGTTVYLVLPVRWDPSHVRDPASVVTPAPGGTRPGTDGETGVGR